MRPEMGRWKKESRHRGMSGGTVRAGLLVLLLFLLLSCGGTSRTLPGLRGARTILPPEKAFSAYSILPDGRRIVFGAADGLMLLDVATGEETPLSREMAWAIWLDEELLRGASGNGEKQYVVNLRPLAVIQLEPLPGGQEALPERIQEADSIYAIVTDSSLGKHMLLLLDRDSFGSVTEGYFIRGVRDLDTLLAGVPYGTPPPYRPCPGNEKVPSPDGRYYYILSGGLRIYSQQGKLLNTDARKDSYCYGWAWDSSGVYVQESKIGMFAPLRVSPLQLLLAEP